MKISEIGNVVFIHNENEDKWAVMFNRDGFFDMVDKMYKGLTYGPGPFLTVYGEMKVWNLLPDENIEDVATEFEFETLGDAVATLDIYMINHKEE